MRSDGDIGRSLKRSVDHAGRFTTSTLNVFSRASTFSTEALAGGFGGAFGLGGTIIFGLLHPAFASYILGSCAFTVCGIGAALAARGIRKWRGADEEEKQRLSDAEKLALAERQLGVMLSLPTWVTKETKDAYARALLATITPSSPSPTAQQPQLRHEDQPVLPYEGKAQE